MEKYDKGRLELSTIDKVSRAIMQEVQEGRGTPRGGVYCDLTFNERGFIAKMTLALNATYLNIRIDPEKDRFEIAPTCHFFMRGIQVDNNWKTRIDGLYGVGEVVGGMHGANRLSQNALAEILVSGVNAGKSAATYARECETHFIDPKLGDLVNEKLQMLLRSKSGIRPSEYRTKLRKLMWEHVGVFRSESSLKIASRCVECFCCLSVCPVYGESPHCFTGPAAFALAIKHLFDPRDELNRELLLKSEGIDLCKNAGYVRRSVRTRLIQLD